MVRPSQPRLSVVVPARNEARNLELVLPALPRDAEIVLVDGHSVDDTVATTRRLRPDAVVVRQTRRGKGNALACGFAVATGDVIVMFDADGSADPSEIPAFVAALVAGADVAKGTRFGGPGSGSEDITRLRSAGNAGLNTLANVLLRSSYSDLCYGYNAFWADMVDVLELPSPSLPAPGEGLLWGDGFEIETLLTCRFARAGARVAEVPSTERERVYGETNLRTFADGFRVLRTLAREFRRPAAPLAPRAVRAADAPRTPAARTPRRPPRPRRVLTDLPPTPTLASREPTVLKYAGVAAASKMISATPAGRRLYRRLGNVVLERQRVADGLPQRYLGRAERLLHLVERHGVLAPGDRVLELGTGWVHWEATVLALHLDVRVTLYDVCDNRLLGAFRTYLAAYRDHLLDPTTRVDPAQRARALELADAALRAPDFAAVYAVLGFDHVVEPTGRLDGLDAGAYALIVSADVLEHVDAAVLPRHLAESPDAAAPRRVRDPPDRPRRPLPLLRPVDAAEELLPLRRRHVGALVLQRRAVRQPRAAPAVARPVRRRRLRDRRGPGHERPGRVPRAPRRPVHRARRRRPRLPADADRPPPPGGLT